MKILRLVFVLAGSAMAVGAAAPPPPRGAVGADVTADPTPTERAAIKRTLDKDSLDMLPATVGHADLNGDGRPDLIYRASGIGWCGSHGCSTAAILATPNGYAEKAIDLAVSFGKVFVLSATHKGMHDLRFDGATYVFKWDGTDYQ
jgi:hypothetical protein